MKNKKYKFYVGCRVVVTDSSLFHRGIKVGDTAVIVGCVYGLFGKQYLLWFDDEFGTVNKSQIVFVDYASYFIIPFSLKGDFYNA